MYTHQVHAVHGETQCCLVCIITTRGGQPPPTPAHLATVDALVERYPAAQSSAQTIGFLNPASYKLDQGRRRQATAAAMMRTIELGYGGMVDKSWAPFVAMEALLEEANLQVANLEIADEDQGQFGGDGCEPDVEAVAAPDTTVARGRGGIVATSVKAGDPAREEAALMNSAQSREHMTYEKHKDKVIVLNMSWQEFYDNSMSKPSDGGSRIRLPVAQFIHVDPWYDADTLSTEDFRKFRKLIDGMAQVGTKLMLWGNFFGLNFWIRMLAGEFSKQVTIEWDVEPTPIVVVRASERNMQGHRGRTLRRNCEFALLATCVEPKANRNRRRNLAAANNADQVQALGLPTGLAHLPKLSDNSNVILEYKPPTKKERLKDSTGKPLRKLAEKSVTLVAQLLARWTRPGDTVVDLFSGSSGMAVALIALGGKRRYIGVDNDPDIMDAVHMRIGRAHLLKAQQDSDLDLSLGRMISFQSLSSAVNCFLLPPHNVPTALLNGNALSASGPHGNLDWVPPATASMFEIKETQMIANGFPLGEGLFLRGDAQPLEAGTDLPDLYFFGDFVETSQLDALFPEGVPGYPGVFELRHPVSEYSLVVDKRCPAAKINDARG